MGGLVVWNNRQTRPEKRRRTGRRKRKKLYILLFILLLAAILLAGCTQPTPPATCTPTLTPTPGLPPDAPTPPASTSASIQTSVHITTIFETDTPGEFHVDSAGLGTIVDINKRVILTHNHYGDNNPDLAIENAWALSVRDSSGKVNQVNNFNLIDIDEGALLIDLANDEITFSQQAVLGNPNNVLAEDDYTTVYWSGSGFVKFDTRVKEVRPQLFVMYNANDIIRRGDSGGGGFVNSKLVGITWSMTNLETFHARKLPDNIQAKINTAK